MILSLSVVYLAKELQCVGLAQVLLEILSHACSQDSSVRACTASMAVALLRRIAFTRAPRAAAPIIDIPGVDFGKATLSPDRADTHRQPLWSPEPRTPSLLRRPDSLRSPRARTSPFLATSPQNPCTSEDDMVTVCLLPSMNVHTIEVTRMSCIYVVAL